MSEILTNSRMGMFRDCARKHFFRYEEGIVPVIEGKALHFGALIHRGLEAWWGAEPTTEARGAAALIALEQHEAEPFDRAKAGAMLIGYTERWGSDTSLEPIAIEQKFEIPLLNPTTLAKSRTWTLGGKVDLLVRRAGRVALMEHKTTSDSIGSDADNYWRKLAMDPQLSLYVMGAEGLGHEVDECIYDVLKKPLIRPLQANTRRAVAETPEEYAARCLEAIRAEPDAYFQRKIVPRSASQTKEFLFDAWQTGRQIREAQLANVAPRNPEACFRTGHAPCPYWDACANGLDLSESAAFRRIGNVHPELEEDDESQAINVA